jgi:hypothetical protein
MSRNWRHYPAVAQRKPGALCNGAPFTDLPEAAKSGQQHCFKDAQPKSRKPSKQGN